MDMLTQISMSAAAEQLAAFFDFGRRLVVSCPAALAEAPVRVLPLISYH
jgi:hypothetical protein